MISMLAFSHPDDRSWSVIRNVDAKKTYTIKSRNKMHTFQMDCGNLIMLTISWVNECTPPYFCLFLPSVGHLDFAKELVDPIKQKPNSSLTLKIC